MPNYSGVWTLQQQLQATAASNWPSLPGAPTIGTATSPSSTTASVAFTPPANLGVPALTSYTATSSPGGLTGTGASSPIVVSGLTAGTTYTFTVTATNAIGTGPASAASNNVTPLPAIGSAFGGGYYAGSISTAGTSVADFALVVGPKASAQNSSKQFKTSNTGGDPTSEINGPANSAAMNSATYPAAQFCEGLTIGGFSDWYLPALNELEICYYNLKPQTNSNYTGTAQGGNPPRASGINPNAVPARASGYTAGTPAQTSVSIFQSGGAEQFNNGATYWSSTSVTSNYAWHQRFDTGRQYSYANTKTGSLYVRALRRVAV